VSEPSIPDTISILRGLKEKYEAHHGVQITDPAIVSAAQLSARYITQRFLPDKAIDLIDEAGARMNIRRMTAPPDLREFDERIARVRVEKEAAIDAQTFSKAIAFNVLAHCGSFADARYTDEEWKLVNESRKILSLPALRVSPTCVRVPVVVGHAIAARATFARPVDRDEAMQALASAPGLVVEDGTGTDGEELAYPTPLASAGRDEVLVGRVREDLGDAHSLNLWVAGDNLLKGAALNTVQLAELVVAEGS
jgi:aspartate-semialdehyde dehydrogenase